MKLDPYRRGVCAQHYHLNLLREPNGKRHDLSGFDAMFFPNDFYSATVLVCKHENIMAGPISFRTLFNRTFLLVDYIEYAIAACAGSGRQRVEFYKHPFKNKMVVTADPTRERFLKMTSQDGKKLFTTRKLDDIFGVSTFGSLVGAQFCC